MMSKKQFACMLTLHITYLFVGAAIFYHIESPLELQQRAEAKLERLEIQNLLYENYLPNDPEKQDNILRKLSQYCGKSMFNYTTEDEEGPVKWDFYHSFFFSYTVVSTIGYGNLAPTVHLSRILMIFYGLFGIPINGILLANLGECFGLQLIKVYRKYKKRNEKRADKMDFFFNNLGMLGQIFLYLVPGFLFFIFLPSCIFVIFEGWDYVGAVYYAFVTLTTIGFGDMVAGTINNGFAYGYFFSYQIFLIVWITFGLGYIVMLLGFITTGMRSEGIHKLEKKLACQFKLTQSKILQGFTRDLTNLRKVINEANLLKVKPIYVEASPHLHRSVSCPNFTFDVEPRGTIVYKRKRANSENINLSSKDMLRIQSDTDLLGIDKEKTFTASAIVKPAELLARVVNVLGGIETHQNDKGVHMFPDNQILATEKPPLFMIGQNIISDTPKRNRALSIAVPNYKKESITKIDPDLTWHNGDPGDKLRKEVNERAAKFSLPSKIMPITNEHSSGPWSMFTKIFRRTSSTDSPSNYLKNTMKGRFSINEGNKETISEKPSGPKTRRGSFFPSFYLGESDDSGAESYKEKTKSGRYSIFPSFDFSEDEDTAAVRSYQKKAKRHSIFPTFDFSDVETDDYPKAYKEKPRTRRRSIFPTFDFSDPEDDITERYKENTRRGRHSIFPTFDFSERTSNDDDTIDDEEVKKYQNRTKKGRFSLFPTFGRNKQNDEEDVMPENSDELNNYQNKTRNGRNSLFPTFSKYCKTSSPSDSASNLEASIKQYHKQTGEGGNNHATDILHYKNTDGGRKSSVSSDLDNYRERTRRGRPSLFDTDVNITSLPEAEQVEMLEHTSVADVLRALALLESATPNANQSITPTGLFDLISEPMAAATRRRGSHVHDYNLPSLVNKDVDDAPGPRRRRISGRGAAPQFTPTLATVVAGAELQTTAQAARENRMAMVTHLSSENDEESQPRVRRYSPAPGGPVRTSSGPVPRLFSRIRKESIASVDEDSPSRRGSLTNIVIDNNKPKT